MRTRNMPSSEKTFACETCPTRKKAEANPKSFMARLWCWQRERQHQVELGKEEKQLTN